MCTWTVAGSVASSSFWIVICFSPQNILSSTGQQRAQLCDRKQPEAFQQDSKPNSDERAVILRPSSPSALPPSLPSLAW